MIPSVTFYNNDSGKLRKLSVSPKVIALEQELLCTSAMRALVASEVASISRKYCGVILGHVSAYYRCDREATNGAELTRVSVASFNWVSSLKPTQRAIILGKSPADCRSIESIRGASQIVEKEVIAASKLQVKSLLGHADSAARLEECAKALRKEIRR